MKPLNQLLLPLTMVATSFYVAATENIDFTMGSISGSVYALGVQVGEKLKSEGDYNVNVKSGGALANAVLIGRNKAQFGHTSSGLALAAMKGTEPFKTANPELRSIAKVMESSFQFLTLKQLPFSSLGELKKMKYPLKLAVGPKGRENELLTRRVLEENGITYDDVRSWGGRIEFVAISDANSLIRDGHLDAVTILSGIPYAPVVEINSSRSLKMIPLNEKTIKDLSEKYGYVKTNIPASTYNGINISTASVAGGVVLVTNSKVSDEIAYKLTQAICSNESREQLATLSGSIKSYLTSMEKCSTGVAIPLHSGAKKYFEENK